MFPIAKKGIVTGTQLMGMLTRRLPHPAERPGPPRLFAESTEQYAQTQPGTQLALSRVLDEIELDRPLPTGLPAEHSTFSAHRRERVPPAIAASIARGRAVGPYGAVVTPNDTLLFDLSPYFGAFHATQHPIFLQLRLPPVSEVQGALAVLTTRGVDNYYHFLIDVLPRLEVLRRAGVRPTRYLVNRTTPFQRELLDHFGISEDATVESAAFPHVRADELLVASLPDSHLRTPPWVVPWLRARLLPAGVAAGRRRLYVTRGQRRFTRRIENEEEVLTTLGPLGFDVIDPGALSVAEQVRLFAEAEIVVGAHGAGLTNIAFCSPGATVIELFPADYVNVCYWALASTVEGLQYRYLVEETRGRPSRTQSRVASDITVDARRLLQLVEQTTAGVSAS
jgi:capsular polysaccharide biosynthesis protein